MHNEDADDLEWCKMDNIDLWDTTPPYYYPYFIIKVEIEP